MGNLKDKVQKILDLAEVKINGNQPWDIKVHNYKFYARVLSEGSLGLGESYMDGWWDCESVDDFFYKILKAQLETKLSFIRLAPFYLKAKLINLQTIRRSRLVGKTHYDIGNELYKFMLDKRMVYTCGYWKNADNLDQAQEDKLDLVCRKIRLTKGMSVLDIGCGWGSFAKFAAEKYGVRVVGITVSEKQVKLARELCHGLDVEIKLQDYRNVKEKFDRVISLGMFEHVGIKNHKTYMNMVANALKKNGLSMLHTIGKNYSHDYTDPWISTYIFPNSVIPSAKHITSSSEKFFVIEDWHNFGMDYDKTLKEWRKNFINNWGMIKQSSSRYNERFFRMWTYYLSCSMATFRVKKNHLWQIVFSKIGNENSYQSIR
ncbi:MAG: cyclopropane fatty acyl phospholipid synthase [bacterium]|nr:cyclopropane fatty acyl phospholipid synthase [bacterium]